MSASAEMAFSIDTLFTKSKQRQGLGVVRATEMFICLDYWIYRVHSHRYELGKDFPRLLLNESKYDIAFKKDNKERSKDRIGSLKVLLNLTSDQALLYDV